jgi:phenylalanyl-tRNA synthetase beta chain
MRAPLSWLREYADVDASAEEIARRLSISSLEVERVLDVGVPDADGNLGRFLVGKVVEAGKHPNADRLQLCRVDVGRTSRARSCAAPGTSRPVRPSPWRCRAPCCPGSTSRCGRPSSAARPRAG